MGLHTILKKVIYEMWVPKYTYLVITCMIYLNSILRLNNIMY